MRDRKIVGDSWQLWIDDSIDEWDFAGEPLEVFRMVSEEFPSEEISRSNADDSVGVGRKYGFIYERVVEFLGKWGIKSHLEGVPPPISEAPGMLSD